MATRLLLSLVVCSLLAAPPQDPVHGLLDKAYQALRGGDFREAISWFHQAAEASPANAAIYKDLAYAYLKAGDQDGAQAGFEQALRLDPAHHRLRLDLAFLLLRRGETSAARELFEQVAKQARPPERTTARRALAQPSKPRHDRPPVPGDHTRPGDASRQDALGRAYAALAAKDYDGAVSHFQTAAAQAPSRVSIRKELGYVYLKIGETGLGRAMFEQAVRLDPADDRTALELAYLRHETGEQGAAFALFGELRSSSDTNIAAAAKAVYERIDSEWSREIARWRKEIEADPMNRSAQFELAELYEKHGQAARAAGHYLAAWVVPGELSRDEILPRLARARESAGDEEGAAGAWLLASRSRETRIAEQAKEMLPSRFPYSSEFRRALELDPRDTALRRELAYLLLAVGNDEEARKEFEIVTEQDPEHLVSAAQLAFLYLDNGQEAEAVVMLQRALASPDREVAQRAADTLKQVRQGQARPHRELGEKSLKASYLNDAKREFLSAYQLDPSDHMVALKLGIVHNLLREDRQAMNWFKQAATSPDRDISAQAQSSYDNLAPNFQPMTTTFWTLPFFSSRYKNVFQYAQLKTEFLFERFPLRPYLSLRFIGDVRQRTSGPSPQFLSESALIAAVGMRTPTRHGVTVWGEAGQAISYLSQRPEGTPRAGADYRGGINIFRARGATLGQSHPGRFAEFNFDGVYLSRFDHNLLGYWQLRPGYRLPNRGRLQAQAYWNFNLTAGRNRDYWGNFVEAGPGIRIRVPGVTPPMNFSVDVLRGVHLSNKFNPGRPNYYDVRMGVWYSFAR